MANWQKMISKHMSDVLESGESLAATLLILPEGGVKGAAISGGVGGVLGAAGTGAGMRIGGDKAVREQQEGQDGVTIAGTFPVGFLLITLTDRRLLVFDRGSVQSKKPQRLVGEYPRDVLVGMPSQKGFMNRKLTLKFSDGSEMVVDGGMAQPFDTFEAAITA